MPTEFNYELIPPHCRDGVRGYIEHGRPVGSFLRAVFENNLVAAFAKADDINTQHLGDYAAFLWNQAPSTPVQSYGSPEIVEKWMAMGGFYGWLAKVQAETPETAPE